MIAIADFGGSLQIAQNFTDDKERLKQVVQGVKFSHVSSNPEVASLGGTPLSRAAMDFGARDVLLALRSLAKNLGSIPGRKTLVFMSGGFPLDNELRAELTAVIDVCNKANVAIYAIDMRGLVASLRPPYTPFHQLPGGGDLVFASYIQQQRGGGGATSGGGGTRTGGGSGGGRTGGGRPGATGGGGLNNTNAASRGMYNTNNPLNSSRTIVPPLPGINVTKNQEVLYALATGTGGFVIANTNDLLGGLEKIGSEQNEYYVLGYTPLKSIEGECHELKVKVDRGGTSVRSRSGYCETKPQDLLAGSPVEKNLETRAMASAAGTVNASMQVPFFYTAPNTARVNVAMEIAPTGLQFAKEKGKLHSEMNVLGIATDTEGGAVAARFSDTVKFDFENKKELEAFQQKPLHYESQFELGSGKYNLKVVFASAGANFGKVQLPLVIQPYDEKKFGLSGVAFSQNIRRVADLDVSLDAALLEDRKPLVSQGMELIPTGSKIFRKNEPVGIYFGNL